jgi:COP9 signalosome complex subunit 8
MISPPARFALTRLPSPLLHHPLTEGLFNLLASTSERKYPQVYIRAKALLNELSADADMSVFGPSMVKSFIGEKEIYHVGWAPSLTSL